MNEQMSEGMDKQDFKVQWALALWTHPTSLEPHLGLGMRVCVCGGGGSGGGSVKGRPGRGGEKSLWLTFWLDLHFCGDPKSWHNMPWRRDVMSSAWLFPLSRRRKERPLWRYQ